MTTRAITRARRAQQFANANRRNPFEVCLEACERALDAIKHGEIKLAEREVEYVKEKLEKVA
jgi:hypothetical protein